MRGEMKICETPSAHTSCAKHCPIVCLPFPIPPRDGQPHETRTGAVASPAASIISKRKVAASKSHHSRSRLTSCSACSLTNTPHPTFSHDASLLHHRTIPLIHQSGIVHLCFTVLCGHLNQ